MEESHKTHRPHIKMRKDVEKKKEKCSEEGEWVLHAASRESQNSADVVATDPTVVPSWYARDFRRLVGQLEHIAQLNGGIYLHDVVVHQHNFVDRSTLMCTPRTPQAFGWEPNGSSTAGRQKPGPLQHILGGVHVDGAPQGPGAPPSFTPDNTRWSTKLQTKSQRFFFRANPFAHKRVAKLDLAPPVLTAAIIHANTSND